MDATISFDMTTGRAVWTTADGRKWRPPAAIAHIAQQWADWPYRWTVESDRPAMDSGRSVAVVASTRSGPAGTRRGWIVGHATA